MEFINNLKYYIREHPVKGWDPCLGNGLGKHIQRFKRIMNWAKSIKWIKENLVGDYPAKLKKNKRKKLSIEALVPLDNQALSDKKLIILVSANQYADILFSIIKKQCIFDSINYESAL